MPTAQDMTGGHLQLLYGPGNYHSSNALGPKGLMATVTDANGFWLRNWTASNEGGSKVWFMIFDSVTQPGDGSTPLLIGVPIPAGLAASWDLTPPLLFSHGLYWIISSTPGTLTYQSSATVDVSMVY